MLPTRSIPFIPSIPSVAVSIASIVLALASTACGDGGPDATDASAQPSVVGAGGASGSGGSAAGPGGTAGATGGSAGSAGTAGTGGAASNGPFATSVVSFTPGKDAGYGQDRMPDIVLGGPHGMGTSQGSLDTLSLGVGGEIVLGFAHAIVDGPGADFLVFENAFYVGGDPKVVWKELGEVAVSDDGATWTVFPCDVSAWQTSTCAGYHPVMASVDNELDPLDPKIAGGDPFDLAVVGVTRARFVRIRDLATTPSGPPAAGFDLDAIAVIHASKD